MEANSNCISAARNAHLRESRVILGRGKQRSQENAESRNSTLHGGAGGKVAKNTALVPSAGAATQLSFLTKDRGWLNVSDKLLSTKDSGDSWTDITPGSKHPEDEVGAVPNAKPVSKRGWSKQIVAESRSRLAESSASSANPVSTQLGFEAYNVPPATPTMASWMSSSPFYDIGIYLQGAKNGHRIPFWDPPMARLGSRPSKDRDGD